MRFGDVTVEYAFSEGMITHGASFLGFVSFLGCECGPSEPDISVAVSWREPSQAEGCIDGPFRVGVNAFPG